MIKLDGKRCLVTGGSRGIGAAIATLLGECGADVVIGYRTRTADADAVVRGLRGLGVRAAAYAADISTLEGSEALVARAVDELGGLDCFIGNAGIWPVDEAGVYEMTTEQWRRTMVENVDSMFYTTRAAARVMPNGGRIVLVCSTAGQRGEAFHSDYAASKGAMISFVKSVAVELGPRDITVNSVAPGWVDTEMAAIPYADGGMARIAAGIPLRRVATARDVAGPVVFLCSSLARHITGEIVNVNGGSVLCG
jgi:3-oxoacyl-[acyl-carrier protein] reductase